MGAYTPVPTLGLTPAECEAIRHLATAARAGDAPARSALFTALAEPIGRMIAARRYLCRGLERDEVTNESFLALADLLDTWTGDDADFVEHFRTGFGRLLWRRLARLHWPSWRHPPLAIWLEAPDSEADLAHAALDLLTNLGPLERWLLIHQLRGLEPVDLASLLGRGRRTLERRRRALALALAVEHPALTGGRARVAARRWGARTGEPPRRRRRGGARKPLTPGRSV